MDYYTTLFLVRASFTHAAKIRIPQNLASFCIGSRTCVATLALNFRLAVIVPVVVLPARTQKVERMRRRILFTEILRDFDEIGDEPIDQLIRQ